MCRATLFGDVYGKVTIRRAALRLDTLIMSLGAISMEVAKAGSEEIRSEDDEHEGQQC